MEENEKVVIESGKKTCYSKELCITALVLGISSIILCWIPVLGFILSIVGLIVSIVANKKRSEHNEDGKGFVITGIVCSIVGTVLGIIISVVLLLTVVASLFVFNTATATVEKSVTKTIKTAADYMSPNEKNVYNSVVEIYSSRGELSGSEIISMINEINTQNSLYVDEIGKFISIDAVNISGYDNTNLHNVTREANVYEDLDSINSQENVNVARGEYNRLKKKISSGKKYVITTKEKDGIIYSVTIKEK